MEKTILVDGYRVTAEQIADAWEWVSDCVWADDPSPETVSDYALVRAVDHHYAGGWAQFVEDGS